MKELWIDLNKRKPSSGEQVLTYYKEEDSEDDNFDILTYYNEGDVLGPRLSRKRKSIIAELFDDMNSWEDVEIADEDGFYFTAYDEDGDLEYLKHGDVITHWQPLKAPKEDIVMSLNNCKIETRYSRTHQKEMEYAEGNVYGDTRFDDGTYIYTSAIVKKDGNIIETSNGSKYILKV